MEGLEVARYAQHLGGLAVPARDLFQAFGKELQGRREDDAVLAGQFLLGQGLAVEVGDLAGAPQVQLHDVEIGFDVVDDLGNPQVDFVHGLAVGAAPLLPEDNQPLAARRRFRKIFRKVEEALQEPVLLVRTVVAYFRRRQPVPLGQRRAASHDDAEGDNEAIPQPSVQHGVVLQPGCGLSATFAEHSYPTIRIFPCNPGDESWRDGSHTA